MFIILNISNPYKIHKPFNVKMVLQINVKYLQYVGITTILLKLTMDNCLYKKSYKEQQHI